MVSVIAQTPITDKNELDDINNFPSVSPQLSLGSSAPGTVEITNPDEIKAIESSKDLYPMDKHGTIYNALQSAYTFPGAVSSAVMGIPDDISAVKKEIKKGGYLNAANQLAMGVPEAGAALLNIPHGVLSGIGKMDIPLISNSANTWANLIGSPLQAEKDLEKKGNALPETKGQEVLRGIGGLAVPGKLLSGAENMASRLLMGGAYGAGAGADPVQSALGGELGFRGGQALGAGVSKLVKPKIKVNPSDLDAELNASKAQVDSHKNYLNELKASGASATPEQTQGKIQALSDQIQQHKNIVNQLDANPEAFEGKPVEVASNHANQAVLDTKKDILDQESKLKSALGNGQQFGRKLASGVMNVIQSRKENLGKLYKDLENKFSKIEVPYESENDKSDVINEAKSNANDFMNFVPDKDDVWSWDENNGSLENLNKYKPGEKSTINGSDLLKHWKLLRDLAYQAKNQMKNTDLDPVERRKWGEKYPALKDSEDKIYKLLENGIDKPLLDSQHALDNQWYKQVASFYPSRVYRRMRNEGMSPSNLISSIDSNKNHHMVMQELLQTHPELAKLAVGQHYADSDNQINSAKFTNYNEAIEPYLNQIPNVKKLRNQYRELHRNLNESIDNKEKIDRHKPAQIHIEKLDDLHDDLLKKRNIYKKQLEAVKKEKNLMKRLKDAEDAKKKYEKEHASIMKKALGYVISAGAYGIKHKLFGYLNHK